MEDPGVFLRSLAAIPLNVSPNAARRTRLDDGHLGHTGGGQAHQTRAKASAPRLIEMERVTFGRRFFSYQ